MAQLTNLWLRMCADNSIDRRCSTDTAYLFQPLPLRPRLIPSRNGRESGVVSSRYEAERKEGRKEGREEKGLWSIDAAATPPPRP